MNLDWEYGHRRTGQLLLGGGLSHLCPKNMLKAPEKTALLTCKIDLPDSPHPIFVNKNVGFRALHIAGRNEFFFRVIRSFSAARKIPFGRKIMALRDSGGTAAPSPAGLYARNLLEHFQVDDMSFCVPVQLVDSTMNVRLLVSTFSLR